MNDPDTLWQELRSALRAKNVPVACEYAGALLNWLDGGGSLPADVAASESDDETRCCAVRRLCLAVLTRPQTGGDG